MFGTRTRLFFFTCLKGAPALPYNKKIGSGDTQNWWLQAAPLASLGTLFYLRKKMFHTVPVMSSLFLS